MHTYTPAFQKGRKLGILLEIQSQLVDGNSAIGPILMKVRLLAAKLGSEELEEWVKFEAEGYPATAELPPYRTLSMAISGHFDFGFGKRLERAPIPPVLVENIAGKGWSTLPMRDSAAAIDSMVEGGDGLSLDLSNLALLLQGKIYEGSSCQQLSGYVAHSALVEISNSIRHRILELTIELEKQIPDAGSLTLLNIEKQPEIAKNVYNQTVMGNYTQVHNSGDNVNIGIEIKENDTESLLQYLTTNGISSEDADLLVGLITSEKPEGGTGNKMGKNVRDWLGKRITTGVDTGIKGGVAALSTIVQEAALQYWGLK